MATIHEQILARLQVLLAGLASVQVVDRSRKVGLERDQTPAIVLRPGPESSERFSLHVDRSVFELEVIVQARGDPWDSITDPIVDDAHRLIFADTALQALVADMRRTAREPEDLEADATAGQETLRYRITYLTRANDLSAPPTF